MIHCAFLEIQNIQINNQTARYFSFLGLETVFNAAIRDGATFRSAISMKLCFSSAEFLIFEFF